jgi:thioredoxin
MNLFRYWQSPLSRIHNHGKSAVRPWMIVLGAVVLLSAAGNSKTGDTGPSACAQSLPGIAGIATPGRKINEPEFRSLVEGGPADKLILVDFYADWCGACKMLSPELEKTVAEYKGAVELMKVDVEVNKPLSRQMDVRGIPAVFAYRGGKKLESFVGADDAPGIRGFIDPLVCGKTKSQAPSP